MNSFGAKRFWVTACCLFTSSAVHAALEQPHVNIYSFREAKLIQPLIEEFSGLSGIKVNVVSGKADKLLRRLVDDGPSSVADLVLTTNVLRLEKAKELSLLQPIQSEFLTDKIPVELRDPEQYWFGISVRTRAIFYSKTNVSSHAIGTYQSLTSPEWKGRICTRKGSHIYNRAMLASFVYSHGEKWANNWVQGLKANLAMRPNGGDRDQLRNIHKGLCDIAIVNSYYYGMMSKSDKQIDRDVYANVGVVWPDQTNGGTHANISGAAVTAAAKNKANAIAFLEFLLTPKAQAIYAEINHEWPVRLDIKAGGLVQSWGAAVKDVHAIRELNRYDDIAQRIIERHQW